jgi:hypothetical protein
MRGVNFEIDGLPVDALVVTSYPGCLILDLSFHVLEVREPTIRDVMKLCPFWLRCDTRSSMRYVDIVSFRRIILAGYVDKLQDERPPCDYPTTSR